ncbi:AsmA-like C-terminal region [Rhizobium sp. RU20A]|uniref:YhdP family protein n=1 Tax=Rhizobium sp. RU20A TaxID=1907412 RepID=UPI000954BB58|nr:DUF3971 domain-containing protein [Rhizobium sp. RU20A]SIQ07459.1 AsmA-like C-terminal region [Rhizobium sp. RU20A]
MGAGRGEKVAFRKQDIVALEALPSAQAEDPILVHCPPPPRILRRLVKASLWMVALFVAGMAGLVGLIEAGAFDAPLNARAESALEKAIGRNVTADVGSTVLRMTASGQLALEARDVSVTEPNSARKMLETASVSLSLDPVSLLQGHVSVSRIEVAGLSLSPELLPRGEPIDLAKARIAAIPDVLDETFRQVDLLSEFVSRSGTHVVRVSDVSFTFAGPRRKPIALTIGTLDFDRGEDGSMRIAGDFSVDGAPATLAVNVERHDGAMQVLSGKVSGITLTPFLHRAADEVETAFGLDAPADLKIEARKATATQPASLAADLDIHDGRFEAGGTFSEAKPSRLSMAYDFDKRSLEITPSELRLGQSRFPLSGAIIDLDQRDSGAPPGFAISLLVQGGVSQPLDVAEPPLVFDAKAEGRFLSDAHRLEFNDLAISSPLGAMFGSLALSFSNVSPELSLAALTERMDTAAVKQLWPWWMGKTSRRWVAANIFGGTVRNGRISVYVPAGEPIEKVGQKQAPHSNLDIAFAMEGARVSVAGDIPPLRDMTGDFHLSNTRMEIKAKSGTTFFPSGRTVALTGGDFIIPDTSEKPLMGEMKISVEGAADAMAELGTYRPIQALQKTPFVPADFAGRVQAVVGARFGLISSQNPPRPVWQTEMTLSGVDLAKPLAGRNFTDLDGRLRIDNQILTLDADANVDGVPLTLAVVEPIGDKSDIKRSRTASGTLSGDDLHRLVPALKDVVDGKIGIEVVLDDKDVQTVSADLGRAGLTLPFIGWRKGVGIGARLSFVAQKGEGSATNLRDLVFEGDGFGFNGAMTVDKSGLQTARFSNVRLTVGDDFSADVERRPGGYGVEISGASADIRPLLARLKSSDSSSDDPSGKVANPPSISLAARLDRLGGFNGESLTGVNLTYRAKGSEITALKLTAGTGSRQGLAANLVEDGGDSIIEMTSGDAGAVARFADIYSNMRGGLLNLKLRDRGANSWRGAIDIRKFALVDENKLRSMVSTPSGADGRSLNQAVKRDIDLSTARFERGYAELLYDQGALRVASGVVRGVDVGATFQGTVRDKRANMDMTGTFMPAYGLNRLFGELPLIGVLLGNGRDRGLLGITFKLEGPFDKPRLTINPLSIIAPGVFRSIFEFQ